MKVSHNLGVTSHGGILTMFDTREMFRTQFIGIEIFMAYLDCKLNMMICSVFLLKLKAVCDVLNTFLVLESTEI